MAAQFILSLDCEGKWGVADGLTGRHRWNLSDTRLHAAYASILSLLEEFQVPATFAFVGLFTQSPREFTRVGSEVEALRAAAPGYLGPALRDIVETKGAGWHGNDYVDAVEQSDVAHEVALHGVTHVPWTSVDESFAKAELRLLDNLEGPVRASRTFIYPRNLIAHTGVLEKHGFEGFRTAARRRSRARSLLAEFNLFETPELPGRSGNMVVIPAGYFLNWRSGLRKLVPRTVTRMRAKRLLEAAASNGGTVHYWLHPENVASAPSTLDVLRMLVIEVANAREAGACDVVTQHDYCRRAARLV